MSRPRARVSASARLHFGFQNLSLTHGRLYGSLGVALSAPEVVVTAAPARDVDAPPEVADFAERAVDYLDLPGASVSVERNVPHHVGLGSGTQHALATAAAVARAHGERIDAREIAPSLGRGGRSGVGVAAFDDGGFVLDGGHPTEKFTTDRPAVGTWSVPPVAARHEVPEDWRFLLVRPDVEAGRAGDEEDRSMRRVVERADPETADRIAGLVTRRLLPAVATGDVETFGETVAEISRLNGAWYADQQGGVYRPPVGRLVDALHSSDAVTGAGQSSWGPTTFGVTTREAADAAREAGEEALAAAGVSGDVSVVAPKNEGARIEGF